MNISGFLSPITTSINTLHMMPRSPVSEESMDMETSTLKPIEQLASSQKVELSSQTSSLYQGSASAKLAGIYADLERAEQQTIQKLSTLDREVRNHERAHAAVGGQYAGAPRYQYERGPDGVNYAVAGEVSISTGAISGDPQMTIEKAQIIRRAALAPAEPSSQDRKVAAEASQMEAQARVELLAMQRDEASIEEEEAMNTDTSPMPKESMQIEFNGASSQDDESIELMNKTQEQIFTEINDDLAAQLVSLGGSQQTPQSLGNIVSRFV